MVLSQKYILLFLFVAFCFTDCKKYPEGPAFSLRTKMARITGVWDIQYYEVDGIDSTSYVINSSNSYKYYFQSKNKSCVGEESHPLDLIAVNSNGKNSCGGWDFGNSKEYIYIEITPLTPGFFPRKAGWNIQRLSNKDLWLKMYDTDVKYYNHNYYIKFKKASEKP